jgi:hypothetical protein
MSVASILHSWFSRCLQRCSYSRASLLNSQFHARCHPTPDFPALRIQSPTSRSPATTPQHHQTKRHREFLHALVAPPPQQEAATAGLGPHARAQPHSYIEPPTSRPSPLLTTRTFSSNNRQHTPRFQANLVPGIFVNRCRSCSRLITSQLLYTLFTSKPNPHTSHPILFISDSYVNMSANLNMNIAKNDTAAKGTSYPVPLN